MLGLQLRRPASGVGSTTNVGTSSTVPTTKGFVMLPGTGTNGGTATVVAAGLGKHTCANVTNDGLLCWGNNGYGELGTGNTTPLGTSPGSSPTGNAPGISSHLVRRPDRLQRIAGRWNYLCAAQRWARSLLGAQRRRATWPRIRVLDPKLYRRRRQSDATASLTNALEIFAPGVTPAPPPLTP